MMPVNKRTCECKQIALGLPLLNTLPVEYGVVSWQLCTALRHVQTICRSSHLASGIIAACGNNSNQCVTLDVMFIAR